MKKRGVTLLEMIVVMAIIIIITAASIPSFLKFINTSRLRAGARDICTSLRTARRYAITKRIKYATAIYGENYATASMKNAVSFYETADSIELKRLPTTISIVAPTVYQEIIFGPRGNVKGVSPSTIQVENDTHEIEITVANTTGRVKIGEISEKP